MDYVHKTIFAYNSNPQKYIDQTMNMVPYDWIDKVEALLPPNAKILDAGCAYGRDANEFFERGFEVLGVDLSEELLVKGREKFPGLALKHMDVRHMDSLPKNSFDGVWCNAVLFHLTDADILKTLKEFHRVLKKDGIMYISYREGEGEEEIVEPAVSDEPRFFNYKTVDSMNDLLEESGFTTIETVRVSEKEMYGIANDENYWICSIAKKKSEGGELLNE